VEGMPALKKIGILLLLVLSQKKLSYHTIRALEIILKSGSGNALRSKLSRGRLGK